MEEDGFGTLFVQQDIPTRDKIVLSYLDFIM
jgi:hypothetical protein